jgi:hypothetical protein
MHRLLVLAKAVVGLTAPDGSELVVAVAVRLEAASGRSWLGTGAQQLVLEDAFEATAESIGLVAAVVPASCHIVTVEVALEAARSPVSDSGFAVSFCNKVQSRRPSVECCVLFGQ